MMKWLRYALICFLLAMTMVVFKQIVPFLSLGTVGFGEFVTQYPQYYWPVDALFWVGFVGFSVIAIILRNQTTSFIQASSQYGTGAKSLEHALDSKLISSQVVSIEDVVPSSNPSEEDVLGQIGKLKEKISSIHTKHINYLGIAHIPFIVKAGVLFGNNGSKLKYWIYYREKQKAKRIPRLGKIKNSFSLSIEKENESKQLLLIVESSYLVDSVTPHSHFDPMDRIRLKARTIGVENTPNEKTLANLAKTVTDTLSQYSSKYEEIHLILSANAPLCFAIGQRINATNMPKVWVYEYSKQLESNRPWGLLVNSIESGKCFRATKEYDAQGATSTI